MMGPFLQALALIVFCAFLQYPTAVTALSWPQRQGADAAPNALALAGDEENFTLKEVDRFLVKKRALELEADEQAARKANGTAAQVSSTSTQGDACAFSSGKPEFPAWQNPVAKHFEAALHAFSGAGINIELNGGTLLGAYRHHGPIPYDQDVDLMFDICANLGVAKKSGSRFAGMDCGGFTEELQKIGKADFIKEVWSDVVSGALKESGLTFVKFTGYGVRLSNGLSQWDGGLPKGLGVGMDVVITAESHVFHHVAQASMCTCKFGSAHAHCSANAKALLMDQYGYDFMTPKSQCQYYREKSESDYHANWNWRSTDDCGWARDPEKAR